MICPSCRTENIEGADLCSNCGESFWDLETTGAKDRILPILEEPLSRLNQGVAITVQVGDPVSLGIRLMQETDSGAVLVYDGERLAGIITAWDLVYKVGAEHQDLGAVRCSEIMTADPITFKEDERIAVAISKMAAGEFRHIPIAHTGAPYTIVQSREVFEFLLPYLV